MSLANPYISADVIEVEEFPDLARQYQVMGVPKTVINDKLAFMGDLPDEALVNVIMEALGLPPIGTHKPDPPAN